MYDVLIIGCGITGAATAFELAKYRLRVGIVERDIHFSSIAVCLAYQPHSFLSIRFLIFVENRQI